MREVRGRKMIGIIEIGIYISMYRIIYLILNYKEDCIEYQFRINNEYISLGYGSLNISLLLLTHIIIISSNKLENILNMKYKLIILIGMYWLLSTLNLLEFFIGFEILLIPILILLYKSSKRYKRIESIYRIGTYTLIGSILFIIKLILINKEINTFELELINNNTFNNLNLIYLLSIIIFFIKLPTFPFHTWLPEAHSEGNTSCSILLAGIYLKVGIFGLIQWNIELYNYTTYRNILLTLFIISFIYNTLNCILQIDIKKIIAYSSIIHINISLVSLYCFNIKSIIGNLYITLTHGLISSYLFILFGYLYTRYNSRNLYYYKGLFNIIPIWSLFFIIGILSNISFPGLGSFIGELLCLIGISNYNLYLNLWTIIGILLSSCYFIFLINKFIFGNLTKYLSSFHDLTFNEFLFIIPYFIFILLFGFIPNLLLNYFEIFTYNLYLIY